MQKGTITPKTYPKITADVPKFSNGEGGHIRGEFGPLLTNSPRLYSSRLKKKSLIAGLKAPKLKQRVRTQEFRVGCMLKILLAALVSVNVWAQTNEESDFNKSCAQAYRVATNDLLTVIKGFQEKRINSTETAGAVTRVAGQVKVVRSMCVFTESRQARGYSDRYKEVYQDVSAKVSPGAPLTGN